MSTLFFSIPSRVPDVWDVDDDGADPAPAAPVFCSTIANKSALQPHVVTPLPADLLPYLAGDFCAVAPPALLAVTGPRTSVLTAVICAAVHAAPGGYTAAEMTAALHSTGVGHPRLRDLVMGALSSQAQVGHLDRHLEVVQERCAGHNDDILRTVSVYTKPRAAGSFEAYGGFRDPDCPKCFRGELLAELVLPAAALDFVRRVRGPITMTPFYQSLRTYAHAWASAGPRSACTLRQRPRVAARSGAYR